MDPTDPTHPRDPIEEVGVEEERRVPEKWIGQEIVLVSVRAEGTRSRWVLDEVNDRGVVVSREGKTGFHPWNTIVLLQLSEREQRDQEVHSF